MVVAGPLTLAGAEEVRDEGALQVVAIEQERPTARLKWLAGWATCGGMHLRILICIYVGSVLHFTAELSW